MTSDDVHDASDRLPYRPPQVIDLDVSETQGGPSGTPPFSQPFDAS